MHTQKWQEEGIFLNANRVRAWDYNEIADIFFFFLELFLSFHTEYALL